MAATGTTTILGAGIIGLSTAYYLAQHQPPSTIHIVEPSPELFASASGFAGGFLARDWFGAASASLGALSFDEHKRLAAAHDGARRWGYQKTTSLSYDAGHDVPAGGKKERGEDWLWTGASRASVVEEEQGQGQGQGQEQEQGQDPATTTATTPGIVPAWLRRNKGDSIHLIGDDKTTAQLDPARLCQFLLDECVRQGVHLHHPARAVAVMTDIRNELSSVRIEDTASATETDIPCTRLIIAAGAWSARVFAELFPRSTKKLPISSLAGHSLVLRSPRCDEKLVETGGCHAIYTTSRPGYSPEAYSRAGGEIWLGGLNSSTLSLPGLATERVVQQEAIAELKRTAAALLGRDVEVTRESLCYRPVTPDGAPILARIGDDYLGGDGSISTRPGPEGGVFVAAGHGPWGISHSLGTGIVLAEMAQGRPLSADVRSLGMR